MAPKTPTQTPPINNVKFQFTSENPQKPIEAQPRLYSTSLSQNGLNINENILSQLMSNNNTNVQQSNYSNVNYMMRRERSLDRCPATENFIENYLINPNGINTRRSYNGTNQSPINNNLYANTANLYSNQQVKTNRHVSITNISNKILPHTIQNDKKNSYKLNLYNLKMQSHYIIYSNIVAWFRFDLIVFNYFYIIYNLRKIFFFRFPRWRRKGT